MCFRDKLTIWLYRCLFLCYVPTHAGFVLTPAGAKETNNSWNWQIAWYLCFRFVKLNSMCLRQRNSCCFFILSILVRYTRTFFNVRFLLSENFHLLDNSKYLQINQQHPIFYINTGYYNQFHWQIQYLLENKNYYFLHITFKWTTWVW